MCRNTNCKNTEIQVKEVQNYKLQEYRNPNEEELPKGPRSTLRSRRYQKVQ